MPPGFVIVDPRTVRAPDGQTHDVLDAIQELQWTAQLCPLMRHEYAIQQKSPQLAWNVLSSMLLARNPQSFKAYFRGYQTANHYWDAPDGRRYWRGNRFEIDRGQPDDAGLRRVDSGATRSEGWAGPRYAPDGIGLYEQDENEKWWPTQAALDAGYQPCRSCERTGGRAAIVATPKDPTRGAAIIAAAEERSSAEQGRSLTRDELAELLRDYPDRVRGPSDPNDDMRAVLPSKRSIPANEEGPTDANVVSKARVVRKLLELRALEAPLGFSGYRGPLTQKAIADVAGVRVQDVTRAAIELDSELANKSKQVE